MVGVEQELLQAARISADLLGDNGEGAVALVDVLDLPVATLEDGDALEHGGGGGGEQKRRRGRRGNESENTRLIDGRGGGGPHCHMADLIAALHFPGAEPVDLAVVVGRLRKTRGGALSLSPLFRTSFFVTLGLSNGLWFFPGLSAASGLRRPRSRPRR